MKNEGKTKYRECANKEEKQKEGLGECHVQSQKGVTSMVLFRDNCVVGRIEEPTFFYRHARLSCLQFAHL